MCIWKFGNRSFVNKNIDSWFYYNMFILINTYNSINFIVVLDPNPKSYQYKYFIIKSISFRLKDKWKKGPLYILLLVVALLLFLSIFSAAEWIYTKHNSVPVAQFAYVTNAGNNTTSVIDTATNTVIATVNVGRYPVGVAITPDGKNVCYESTRQYYVYNWHFN